MKNSQRNFISRNNEPIIASERSALSLQAKGEAILNTGLLRANVLAMTESDCNDRGDCFVAIALRNDGA